MARFDTAISTVFHHEGGFVNDPDDRGGATNMGITHITLAEWRGVPSVTAEDVRDLSKEEAGDIYRAQYWNKMRLDEFSSQALAEAVMDFGVNAGPERAGKALQEAVNWYYRNDVLAVDGIIGPSTILHTNTTPDRGLILKFFEIRTRYYAELCRQRRSQRKFLYAWIRRSLDCV